LRLRSKSTRERDPVMWYWREYIFRHEFDTDSLDLRLVSLKGIKLCCLMALAVTLVMTSWVLFEGLFGFFRPRELILRSLDLLYLPLASRKCLREF
jgi:hypothetical protein